MVGPRQASAHAPMLLQRFVCLLPRRLHVLGRHRPGLVPLCQKGAVVEAGAGAGLHADRSNGHAGGESPAGQLGEVSVQDTVPKRAHADEANIETDEIQADCAYASLQAITGGIPGGWHSAGTSCVVDRTGAHVGVGASQHDRRIGPGGTIP